MATNVAREMAGNRRTSGRLAFVVATALLAVLLSGATAWAQRRAATVAPSDAPSSVVVAATDKPGERLVVEGTVVGADGRTPVAGASVYAYHTDAAGSYGPGGNRDPRLRAYLRTDARGHYRFETVKPGSYPGGGIAAHIHFHFAPPQDGSELVTEVVFEGDPALTDRMRRSDGYAVLPLQPGADGALHCTYDVRLPAD